MSLVQILPLHLAQVGWGSVSKVDRKAPHFLAPTPGQIRNSLDITNERERKENTQAQKLKRNPVHPPKSKHKVSSRRRRAGHHGERGLYPAVVEQRMTVEPRCWGGGGGVSHPLQLTTGLVINSSVTTSPTLAGERMLLIPKVSILSEHILFISKEKP